MTIQMSFNAGFYLRDDRWMFVRDRDFDRADLDRYFVGRRENHELIRNARIIKNTRIDKSRNIAYVTGPDAREVRTVTGRAIKPLPVNENNKPGRTIVGKDQVQIFRPPVSKVDIRVKKPLPGKVVTRDNIMPIAERTKGNLVKTNSDIKQGTGKEQITPAKKTVPPKYQRTDKINQDNNSKVNQGSSSSSGQTRNSGTVNDQKSQVPPRKVNPPSESRKVEQSNPNRNQQPPVETRKQDPSKRQIGAPDHKPQNESPKGKGNGIKKEYRYLSSQE
jgi:hypothetical protein